MWEMDDVMAAAVLLGLVAYIAGTWHYDHFSRMRVKFVQPAPFLGNMSPLVFRTRALAEVVRDLYTGLRGRRCGGVFEFARPVLLLRDPQLVGQIAARDSEHFTARRLRFLDPVLGRSLHALTGQRWKDVRSALCLAFTSSSMTNKFLLVSECAQRLVDHLQESCSVHEHNTDAMYHVELREVFSKFTTDVLAMTTFGVHYNSFKDSSNVLYKIGKKFTNRSGVRHLIFLGHVLSPRLMKFLNIPMVSPSIHEFFLSLIQDTIPNQEQQLDVVHLLMQARQTEGATRLDDDDITAQAALLFLAGLDTSTSLVCFASFLLATHPDIQRRLRREVDSAWDGISYDTLQDMVYLHMVLSETLRLFPPVVLSDRKCVKTYKVNATGSDPGFTLNRGDGLWIPIYALHRDPLYFTDPEKFDPERFSNEKKHNIKPFTYLPFGVGSRDCIGQRLALLEAKIAIVYLLTHFTLHAVKKTSTRIRFNKKSFILTPEKGVWIGIQPRQK